MPDLTPTGTEETFTRGEILKFREDLYQKGKEKEKKTKQKGTANETTD